MLADPITDAAQYISNDPVARRIFRYFERATSQSGWALAKELNLNPDLALGALAIFRDKGVLDSSGAGLDGFYYLTSLGFRLREYIMSRSSA